MIITAIRNLMIVAGIYYLAWWVISPLFMIHRKITAGIIYNGGIFGSLFMGIISALPVAIGAFGAGILSPYILEGTNRKYWIASLSLFYAITGLAGFSWAQQPEMSDRVFQVIQSIFPAISCYLGGIIILKTHKQK